MTKTLNAKIAVLEGTPTYYACPGCAQWLATEDEQGAVILHPKIVSDDDGFIFSEITHGFLTTPEGQESLAQLQDKIAKAEAAGDTNIVLNIRQTIKIFSAPEFPRPDWRPLTITKAENVRCKCGACVLVTPRGVKAQEPTMTAHAYNLHTGEECGAFVKSASDGKSGRNWRTEAQRGVDVWEDESAPFRVEVARFRDDDDEFVFSPVEELIKSQGIGTAFVLFYVCGVLSPTGAEAQRTVGGWIDLTDVLRHIGWLAEKPDAARRDELRARVWDFLRYGARAKVTGERSTTYRDRTTGEIIPTRLSSAPWKITDEERPDGQPDAAPLRAYVVFSQQWKPLLTLPDLCQYMPLGELLAEVAPNKVGGDWARVMGYTLARSWRIKPRETEARTYSPTRRALLTTFAPQTTLEEVLEGPNPKRAVEYYRDALGILADKELIAREGDAAREVTPETMLNPLGRQGWQKKWLDEESGVFPGPNWKPTVEERAAALPEIKPKDLKAAPKRRAQKGV